MFNDDQTRTIFGNLEQLLEFQEEFLEDLERHVDTETPHRSCLGDTFLRHVRISHMQLVNTFLVAIYNFIEAFLCLVHLNPGVTIIYLNL